MIVLDFLRIVLLLVAVSIMLAVIYKLTERWKDTGFLLLTAGAGSIMLSMAIWTLYNSHIFSESSYPIVRILTGYLLLPLGIVALLAGVFYTLRQAAEHTITLPEQPGEELPDTKATAQLYRTLFQKTEDARFLLKGNTFIDCNAKALQLLNCSRDVVLNTSPEHFFTQMQEHVSSPVDFSEKIALARDGESQRFEAEFSPREDEALSTEVEIVPQTSLGKSQSILLVTARAISSGKQARQKAANADELLSEALQSINDGVILSDIHGKISLVNPAGEDILGKSHEDIAGRQVTEIFTLQSPQSRELLELPIEDVLHANETTRNEIEGWLTRSDKIDRYIRAGIVPVTGEDGKPAGAIIILQDLTHQHRTKKQLRQAQQMESVGEIARKFAHDFNNILEALLGDLALGKVHCDRQEKVLKYIGNAEQTTNRARELTNQLLTLTSQEQPEAEKTELPRLIEESLGFALRNTENNYHTKFADDLKSPFLDSGQIKNVLYNIITNAREAMPEGGIVTVTAENMEVNSDYPIGSLSDGTYVKISISDEGSGIPSENISQIFEPFFTTWSGHSGMGLASVYTIVKNHSGHVEATSAPEDGTTITFYLPVSNISEIEIEEQISSGKILVMDNESSAREKCSDLLEYLGHRVFGVSDGNAAVQMYRVASEKAQPFDAVILDLNTDNGMGATDIVQQLLEINPDVKAVVSHGFSNDLVMTSYAEYGFQGIITKPYTLDELNRVMQKVLES